VIRCGGTVDLHLTRQSRQIAREKDLHEGIFDSGIKKEQDPRRLTLVFVRRYGGRLDLFCRDIQEVLGFLGVTIHV
jgi:hypothetical protein